MTTLAATTSTGKSFSNAAPVIVFMVCAGIAMTPFKYSNNINPQTIVEGVNQAHYLLVGEASDIVISDIGSEKYKLAYPINASLRQEDTDEYVASFGEAELSRSGDTPKEAIDWLKSSVVTVYDLFKNRNADQLGPLPTRQLRVLGNYLVAKSNPKT
jgi:hypothetical protein